MMCSSGPPCVPGKTCLSTALAWVSRQRMNPPRGPRNVLWVVLVTISACGTGDGWTPPATRPAKCAMSTREIALTSRAIAANPGKCITRGYALPPALITLVRSFRWLNNPTAAVVPLAGIAFRVLVGELRAGRVHHRSGGEVLARDELQSILLARHLPLDDGVNVGIGVLQAGPAVAHGYLSIL